MKDALYAALGLPEGCLVNRRVYKKHFYDHGRLSAGDERLFAEDVDQITWKYALKPDTTGIRAYEDDESEYTEIVLLEVVVRHPNRVSRLAELIHKTIPYPLIIVFVYPEDVEGAHSSVFVSAARKRLSRSGTDAPVVEDYFSTDWIKLSDLTPAGEAFLKSIHFSMLSHAHFKAWYQGLIDGITALNRAKQVGRFEVAKSEEARRMQQAQMERYNELEKELTRLQAAVKREHQFNRQVELNMKIKKIRDELRRLSEY